MKPKLTEEEREEIRALFQRAAEIQAQAILGELREVHGHE